MMQILGMGLVAEVSCLESSSQKLLCVARGAHACGPVNECLQVHTRGALLKLPLSWSLPMYMCRHGRRNLWCS